MSALAITPAGILTGIAITVLVIALAGSALVWWTLRRSRARRTGPADGPVIDLTYLEQAIRADEDATARSRRPGSSAVQTRHPARSRTARTASPPTGTS